MKKTLLFTAICLLFAFGAEGAEKKYFFSAANVARAFALVPNGNRAAAEAEYYDGLNDVGRISADGIHRTCVAAGWRWPWQQSKCARFLNTLSGNVTADEVAMAGKG
ncbi:MAG: hypothetical protein LBQ49_02075 [Rickettsiales bacterium]|jgi:hypothetical protein|nr:hypothetical protein [Rickettsiales bacterium]